VEGKGYREKEGVYWIIAGGSKFQTFKKQGKDFWQLEPVCLSGGGLSVSEFGSFEVGGEKKRKKDPLSTSHSWIGDRSGLLF